MISNANNVTTYKSRIIVADDIGSTRMLLKEVLGVNGYEVAEAKTAGEVLGLLADERFDFVVLNLTMPPHRGVTYVQQVRSLMRSGAKLIVFTANDDEETMDATLNAGADIFLPSPISLRRLLKNLES